MKGVSRHPGAVFASDLPMARLVFDIETSALPLEQLDAAQQEYLFRDAERLPDQVSSQSRREQIQQQFNLWPFTARIVCVAMINAETCRGQVLFLAAEPTIADGPDQAVRFVACVDEAQLLGKFWEIAHHYEHIVTFNGRGFDVPFIYLRSAILGVPISRKDWLGYRFQTEPHCDLAEQLTFYGVSGREGAARRFNLDFYCKAFGILSPKAHGITGLDVNRLLDEGRFRDIADYCLRDVQATLQLYQIWKERLAGIR
jgi:DNA polymerase elongation subunit (family B)